MLRIDLQWKFVVLLSIFSVVLCDWVPPTPQNQRVCNSQTCKDRGSEYLNNMVRSVNPCEDFFTFACGAWEKNHPPTSYVEWDVPQRMADLTLATLKILMEELPSQQTDGQIAKLKVIFDTCSQIPHFDRRIARDIVKEIGRIRRYPLQQLWHRHNEYLKLTGESALFNIDVGGFNDSLILKKLQFAEPVSAFGSIYPGNIWRPKEEENYKKALFEMLSLLGLPDSTEDLKKRIDSVCEFRRKLFSIRAAVLKIKNEVPVETSSSNLQTEFVQLATPLHRNKSTIAIPWEQIVQTLFHKMSPLEIKKNIIVLYKAEYFTKLANLLGESSEQLIADHMEIYFVERHLRHTEKVKELLEKSWRDFYSTYEFLRMEDPRWITCIEDFGMTPTLADLFISKLFKVEHKYQVTNIFTGIKAAVKTQVSESKWLDNNSKALTLKALDDVKESFGEPRRYNETSDSVRTIFPDAFLDMKELIMFVNAAMLRNPVFDPTLPVLYNIASVGYLLGHEFYHVIDNCGHRWVSILESVTLWPGEMEDKCKDRKKCFIDEYDKFNELEFKRRYKLSPKIDTYYSFLENFPDVMGLQAAHMFHSRLLKRDRGQCFVLPGFEGYSCDQMFFLSFANVFCGTPSAKGALAMLENENHSINPVRINGAVSSTKAFADAFKCGKRDTMNPSTKCNLWI